MGKHFSLANRLKELRRGLGWTQQDLSGASGLTRSYISRLEMGDIALPSSEKLRSLAQSLGTTPDDLLQAAGYIDNPSEASDLPDIKIYLRRKYAMQEPRALQAIEIIVNCLQANFGTTGASTPQASSVGAEGRGNNRSRRPLNNQETNGVASGVSLSRQAGSRTGEHAEARRSRKS